jgi:hypothetical protein
VTHQLFNLPPQQPLTAAGRVLPGAKAYFFLTDSSTPTPVYTTADLDVAHEVPVEADVGGRFPAIYLDPTITYKVTVNTAADVLLYTIDPCNDVVLSQSLLGEYLYPRTAAEIAAGITPTDYAYPEGNVKRYGAVGDGVTDDSDAIQRAIDVLGSVVFPDGNYLCNNITQDESLQRFYAQGEVRLIKNANGALFTSSGDNVEVNGIAFRGDAASPSFTGDGVVSTGDHFRILNCGARWFSGRALKATGQHVQVIGTCDIYQTTDVSASGYDIEIGESGTATLYHSITDIYTSQPTGGILATDTGSLKVIGSQFAKLTVANGTGPAGINGGNYIGCRILGDITVSVSSSVFAGNTIGNVAVSFAGGTNGHRFDRSNSLSASATLTDSSTASVVEDSRLVPFQSYTPTFTSTAGSPDVGNGTLVGRYSKKGREVTAFIRFVIGGSTNVGSGTWSFSLPSIPNTTLTCIGSLLVVDATATPHTGVSIALANGTAFVQGQTTGAIRLGSATPITWATGDEVLIGITYFTD